MLIIIQSFTYYIFLFKNGIFAIKFTRTGKNSRNNIISVIHHNQTRAVKGGAQLGVIGDIYFFMLLIVVWFMINLSLYWVLCKEYNLIFLFCSNYLNLGKFGTRDKSCLKLYTMQYKSIIAGKLLFFKL